MFEELKRIPHLRLPITFDVKLLREEVSDMPELIGYELPGEDRSEEERGFYRRNWKGRGLIDFEDDSSKGMFDARPYQGGESPLNIRRSPDGKPYYWRTELANTMPSTFMVIDQLFREPGRCRITSMRSGGSLFWHSHCQFRSGNYEEHGEYDLAIVHVPIITNPEVKFGVAKFERDNTDHRTDNPYLQHYAAGECWLLNAWHEHNVFNEGFNDRIHLMMYGSLRDPKLLPYLATAMGSYEGPYIE